jgi:hypothetical protein
MADKVCVKLRASREISARHHTAKRVAKRLLCSNLAQLHWVGPDEFHFREIVILEHLSLAGVGLFMGLAIPQRTRVELIANDVRLTGNVKQCSFRENGYIVELELDSQSKWAQEPGSTFLPEHLLDVSLLDSYPLIV